MAAGLFPDLLGTSNPYFLLGLDGPRLKRVSTTVVAVRNNDDSADATLTVGLLNVSGNSYVLNSDAAGSGADWTYTIQRPSSGMTAAVTLTLPDSDGSPSQVLSTDGSGVLSWVDAGSTASAIKVNETALAFGTSSPVTLFTLPANAEVIAVKVIVDTAFSGTAPTVTVGIAGNTAKYMGSGGNNLKSAFAYESHPNVVPTGSTESLIATYSADSSSAGAARIQVWYAIAD